MLTTLVLCQCCYEESLAVTESSRREVAQEDRTFLFDAVASKDGRATVLTDGLTTDDLEEKEDISSSMYTHMCGNKRGSINKARRESKFPLQVTPTKSKVVALQCTVLQYYAH